ncbi:MAG: hypothetical protein HKO56_06085 [Bacteroidia bacterium]|nr:hypothetical protein [Bacteroidia bacterium]NNM16209.1 hypothetical protein [Bacteroidia bacterium]
MATKTLEKRYAFERTLDLNYFIVGEKKKNLTAEELMKRAKKIQRMIAKSQRIDNEKFFKAVKDSSKINYQFGAQ